MAYGETSVRFIGNYEPVSVSLSARNLTSNGEQGEQIQT